ncbi:hypothetical protein PFHG_03478 [Plasmodium falciparum HB3]|uniref:Erythrocyte membrane protein 1 n=1 Tax=Plasmodium falciparum (isolate HB3) TaxID=137071 RepID=A0A0L7KF52_PLAFX|nr:hypothetical protein PFHG_03478 [Plasmodium falciparum HB3]
MAPQGGSGGTQEQEDKYKNVKDAKELLDRIGEDVYKKAKNDANVFREKLKGTLSQATNRSSELSSSLDPCSSDYTAHFYANNERYPCRKDAKNEDVNRFSDTLGGQCTDSKMRSGGKGACAPLRRLHVCVRNLESISDYNSTNAKHKLLLDVCLAAKYEGESLNTYSAQYDEQYPGSGFTLCTMLARSFADIGDIVRGKDLFRGYDERDREQKKKIQDNLNKIFKEIYEELIKKNTKNGKAKEHYKEDKETGNYYKLREDWWYANRATVWKAITCNAAVGNKYFRPTCGGGDEKTGILTPSQCRCDDKPNTDPPTYFDYVPQYLRWFEEWAEDFCRKRKHKLENAIKKCREKDKNSEERYCSGNGFDCAQTIRVDNELVEGECHKCSVACSPFVKWLDNQKLEFEKQKEKYTKEIQKAKAEEETSSKGRKRRSTKSETYEGYDKEFYNKLKETDYKDVKNFLNILNKEGLCEKQPEVEGKKIFNFADEDTGTKFSRTKICEPCPWCGAEKDNTGNGKWKDKELNCAKTKTYNPENITEIRVLYPDISQSRILDKYKKFCKNGANGATGVTPTVNGGENGKKGDQIETWQCYYDENKKSGQNNNCILGDWKKVTQDKKVMSYNAFFWDWVYHMLHDSLDWRKQLGNCINKDNGNKCKSGCNTKCKCFEKWVEQKGKEWKAIKEHFDKQKDIPDGRYFLTLEGVLEKGVLLTSIKEGYGNEKDIEHIKQLLDEEEAAGALGGGGAALGGLYTQGPVAGQDTTIDKILQHEDKDATKCKNCKPPEDKSAARSQTPRGPTDGPSRDPASDDNHVDSDDANEDDEDEEEDDDEVEASAEEETEEGETHKATEEIITTPDVCPIVKTALTSGKLDDACALKYGLPQRHWGWKCVTPTTSSSTSERGGASRNKRNLDSTKSSDKNGSICIPPRRRKLYIKKIQDWAESQSKTLTSVNGDGNGSQEVVSVNGASESGESGSQGSRSDSSSSSETPSQPNSAPSTSESGDNKTASDKLRTAFIQSAAVETFFLWDRYKKEWMAQKLAEKARENGGLPLALHSQELSEEVDPEHPQKKLKSGNIPPDFLRLMFYTLGDYRDICIGKTPHGIDTNGKDTMKKIKENIEKLLPKNADSQPPSDKTPQQTWWSQNGEHIWKGMVCALTYKDNTDSGAEGTNKIEKDSDVYNKFFGENGTSNEPIETYKYDKVQLKEENSGTKTDPLNNPKLSDFVLRPPFFRYLEEWGETFCREKKKRLEEVEKGCKVNEDDGRKNGNKKCSGYGEDCETNLKKNPSTFPSLECPDCAKHCRLYKKWIEKKKIEFTEQENAYDGQKDKCETESDKDAKQVCDKLTTTYTTAGDFLQTLKNGPCKNNENVEGKKGEDDINFKEKDGKTFKHTKHCDPCSQFRVKCENGRCNDVSHKLCNGKNTIDATEIENIKTNTKEVTMLVSDSSKNEFKDGLDACREANIFKGIRKDVWKCGNVCGYVVCKPEKGNGKENQNKIITIRALLHRWLEYFLEDYNKIKHRISHCTKNGEGSKCENKCEQNCKKCAQEWLKLKQKEWKEIKDRLLEQYKNNKDSPINFNVKSSLEKFVLRTEFKNAIKPCKSLENFEKSCGLNGDESSKKSKKGTQQEKDLVQCLLEKLQKKISECKDQLSDETQTQTRNQTCEEPILDDEEDLTLEETEENPEEAKKNMMPKICEDVLPKTETAVEEETCDAPPAEEKKDEKKEESEEDGDPAGPPTSTPAAPKQPEKQPQPPSRPKPPQIVYEHPLLKPALMSSTIMWSIGIGFATFTYFYLKKKTKSSVGSLFQILQIPKGDYGIPTLKSSNRYIPYASERYKGKTYIYMEGDTSGDEKYAFMSDTTDVTSSESEYEELDINDIYVPGSPKYKTLIEVVLEPSKRDIQSDDTPSSDTPMNKFTDEEWNQLKHDFISQYIQSEPLDVTKSDVSTELPMNIVGNVLDDGMDEKPFIMSIHDRNLYIGQEYSYDMSTNSGGNGSYSGISPISDNADSLSDKNGPTSGNHNLYSGTDLINDALNGDYDIYDEILKRKENELFGTNHTKKNTSTNSVAKNTNSDPILNQINLFHTWLDRHRDMCDQWDKNKKEELLDKLKKEWNKENNNNGDKTYNSDNKPSHNHVLNTDVSIQIDMDNPKTKNEFTNMDTNPDKSTMDTILDDLEKYNEPYYYDFYKDDIYYDVNDDDKTSVDHINMDHNKMDNNNSDVPTKVQIEMNVINNQELLQNEYPISHM